jgi:hypothetical protein
MAMKISMNKDGELDAVIRTAFSFPDWNKNSSVRNKAMKNAKKKKKQGKGDRFSGAEIELN